MTNQHTQRTRDVWHHLIGLNYFTVEPAGVLYKLKRFSLPWILAYLEKLSMYLSTSSANNRSWRWWDSDIVWHLNPFWKEKNDVKIWPVDFFQCNINADVFQSLTFSSLQLTSSRHCFWHIWQYHRNFCNPLALILFAMALGVNGPAFSFPML